MSDQPQADRTTFTVFTVDENGDHPTTHITSVEAADIEDAKRLAIAETAEAWEQDASEIRVLGVAAGEVEILDWQDEAAW